MARNTLTVLFVLFLFGCSATPVKLRTEVQEVYRPVLYCPAPNWDELARPELTIYQISDDASPGEVAKRYKATVKQLQDYATRLEQTLKQYDTTNEAYDELRDQLINQQKSNETGAPLE